MPKYLPLSTIRSMTYAELERWWETDFDVLEATAVAEATGDVQPSVAQALRSEEWLEQWADALYAAAGQLATSVERMEYANDARLETTRKRAGLVDQRRQNVNTLLRQMKSRQGWDMAPDRNKHADGAVLAILAGHFKKEAQELAEAEIARRGLAPHHPLWDLHCDTKFDSIEDAVRRGLLNAPVTPGVTELLGMSPRVLTDRVAADATRQEDRCAELRHPLLLRGWLDALEHLFTRHCELAGIDPVFSIQLPALKMYKLRAMDPKDAQVILNRRRFIRGLAQRHRECQMHVRELARTTAIRQSELKQPWTDAVSASCEELGRRHPDEFKALVAAFRPYCVPGSMQIRREFLGGNRVVARKLIPSLKRSLADGSWRNLPDDPAA